METIIELLNQRARHAFMDAGYDPAFGLVSWSGRPDLCQFQINGAFRAAKSAHKAPLIVAQEVASILATDPLIHKAEALKPGFINLDVTDELLVQLFNQMSADPRLGIDPIGQGKKIVLDFGGANVAKPLHVGHLRTAIIGESIKRITRLFGYQVIGDIHMGDWGLQMGQIIVWLKREHPNWACMQPDFSGNTDPDLELTLADLSVIYPKASALSKEDPDFHKAAQQATYDLQMGRPGYRLIWQKIMACSLTDLRRVYGELGVHFDLWYGESDAQKYIPQLMDELNAQDLLKASAGAKVVDVALPEDKAPMPPVIIEKSDGSAIYATTDLATIIQRQTDFAPQGIWYVVDKRQSLHFTQVFRCAHLAKLVPADCDLEFLGFGTMNGPDGKPFKTRAGGTMKLSDLLDQARQTAREKLDTSSFVDPEMAHELADKVALAAVKFGDLINQRQNDYVFDLDKFLSFEGKTGVYLLYNMTRILSILRKVGVDPQTSGTISGIYTEQERDLILGLLRTPERLHEALDGRAPDVVAEHAYQSMTLFSKFYAHHKIATQEDLVIRTSWIQLIIRTHRLISMLLDLLGIETVARM